MNDQQQSRADALTSMFAAHPELQDDRAVFLASQVRAMLRNVLATSANETGAEGAQSWTDGYRAALNVVASDVRALFVNYVHCKGADGLLERCKKLHEQIAAEADRLLARSRSPAMAAEAPVDGACKRCGSTTAQACNYVGCFYLESGDGEPSAAPADERAPFDLTDMEWLSVFERVSATIPNVFGGYMKVRAAFAREAIRLAEEARAAASPTAEVVATVDERISGMPDEVRDAMMDSQYLAGVTAGWNAANADDPNAALKKIHDAYNGYLSLLRDWQKAGRRKARGRR